MYIETDRLIIRDMELSDEPAYVEMAPDGSLDEDIFAGCSNKYHEWMHGWIAETIVLNQKDNLLQDYLAYSRYMLNHYTIPKLIANIRTANQASCKTVERAGYTLIETKMYKDVTDTIPKLYNFIDIVNMFTWAGCKTRVHHLAGITLVACLNHKVHIQKIYISLIDAEE